jgi:hypothetical protein
LFTFSMEFSVRGSTPMTSTILRTSYLLPDRSNRKSEQAHFSKAHFSLDKGCGQKYNTSAKNNQTPLQMSSQSPFLSKNRVQFRHQFRFSP